MTVAKESNRDEACDPLLGEEGFSTDIPRPPSIKATKCQGLVRKKRSSDTILTPFNSTNTLSKKKRLIVFLVLIIALIYVNSSVMTWGDHNTDRITVFHHSHVPGMKDITKIANKNLEIIATASALTNISVSPTIEPTVLTNNSNNMIIPPGYLVWSDQCKMPNLDPYAQDVMKHFKREKYEKCSTNEPLTNIKYNATAKKYMLNLEDRLKDKFTKLGGQLNCCYEVIERSGKGKKADKDYSLSACMSLPKSVELPVTTENVLVKCSSKKSQTYINVHAMVPDRPEVRQRLDEWKNNSTKRPISILMIGIDSISRQNLIRAMPKTAQHLYDSEWFEMSGYNKVDDNTFPNFLALFAGFNSSTAYNVCEPTKVSALDKCPFLWYDFQRLGYVTAYAEDETSISTFNYLKVGFQKQPTDFYLRPALIAAEKKLSIKRKSGLIFCLGYQHSADYVYDYALEFANTYRDDPYFGLFWTNTFSHNAISDPSSMDEKMFDYFQKFDSMGILNNSVVIFFSDHGIRFGPTRELPSGRIEERLPFFFIWLPPWFKNEHPEFVNALNVNKNRLTNPYDVHMTLKHLLELSGRAKNLEQAPDCENCQTLLKPVPHSRSCEQIAIEDHWCTCVPYKNIYKDSAIVRQAVNYTIDYINAFVSSYKNGSLAHICAKLHLHKIKYANRAVNLNDQITNSIEGYQFVFEAKPGGGLFEATIRYNVTAQTFEITGSISRLNTYASNSKCLTDGSAKKYCHCTKSGGRNHRRTG